MTNQTIVDILICEYFTDLIFFSRSLFIRIFTDEMNLMLTWSTIHNINTSGIIINRFNNNSMPKAINVNQINRQPNLNQWMVVRPGHVCICVSNILVVLCASQFLIVFVKQHLIVYFVHSEVHVCARAPEYHSPNPETEQTNQRERANGWLNTRVLPTIHMYSSFQFDFWVNISNIFALGSIICYKNSVSSFIKLVNITSWLK